MRRKCYSLDHTLSRNDDHSSDGQRNDFLEMVKKIITHTSVLGKMRKETTTENSKNSSLTDLTHTSELKDFQKETGGECLKHGTKKTLQERLGTLSSVDSNYRGFGLSKSMRSDFLTQIDSFQNMCLTEEVSEDLPSVPRITHWQDESVFIPYSDDNLESHEEKCLSSSLSDHSVDEIDVKMSTETDVKDYNTNNIKFAESPQENTCLNELLEESRQAGFHSRRHSTIRSSTYFDMFSSFDHSHLHNNVEPSDIAMLGDVISLATNTGEHTIFRVAGAGLRYGTVGVNNSFQV